MDHAPGGFALIFVKICLTVNSRTDRELYSTEVQQPARATAILSSHRHTNYAAPMPSEQERANGLHPEGGDLRSWQRLEPRHARLAVGAAATLGVFLYETHEACE